MAEDNSFKATDCAKFRGYLRKWKTSRMPILMSMFLDILQPAKFLSLAFQDDEIDTVKSSQALQDAQSHLSKLERKSFQNLPHVKFFLSKVKSNDEGQHEYQVCCMGLCREPGQEGGLSKMAGSIQTCFYVS